MGIKYHAAPDIERIARDIVASLAMHHDFSRITFLRSTGSQSRRTIARCHALPRVMQAALACKGHYAIEVIAERFDPLSEEERLKTVIHELLHVPKSMGGGSRHHDYACEKDIGALYRQYRAKKAS